MQGNETGRAEPYRPSSFSVERGADASVDSLPDTDAFRLASQVPPASRRIVPTTVSYRRERHPDADETRNGIFEQLVSGDEDVAGLIAYSIYKQHKRDWLKAFDAAKSRAPTLDEETAYAIGEATARRLAMYRHIARETLDGQGPAVKPADVAEPGPARSVQPVSIADDPARPARRAVAPAVLSKRSGSMVTFAVYAAILTLAGFGLWAGLRAVFPSLFH